MVRGMRKSERVREKKKGEKRWGGTRDDDELRRKRIRGNVGERNAEKMEELERESV